ncbi:imidazoleglycerol-phosphate dehydratase [Ochromonadaceae sp. CCMP2298]|nr:imidazoleglycerol-phosphate dehydratase [Ochromonadaceae sp. CCMP2298]
MSSSSAPIRAVLYDMDGVLASVGTSYREAIVNTAKSFGVAVSHEDISIEKKRGNANNDWVLTKRLIETKDPTKNPSLQEVTDRFERIYQGTADTPGLCESETLIPSKGLLFEVSRRCQGRVAVVTGRPRKDCIKFLETHGLRKLFPDNMCVCMEDVERPKPDPIGVQMACAALGEDPMNCVIIGDTPDDIKAGKAAGTYAWGVLTPDEHAKVLLGLIPLSDSMHPSLLESGADGVMPVGLGDLLDLVAPLSGTSDELTRAHREQEVPVPGHNHSHNHAHLRGNQPLPLRGAPPPLPHQHGLMHGRVGTVEKSTKETSITATVCLDGTGKSSVSTGLGFLDHMFSQLAKHGRFDISLNCEGDLYIDDHHTAEDCALALGEAFDKALGPRVGIYRFGMAHCPLDEALSRVVVDISSRPHAVVDLKFTREKIGDISCEMLQHVLESFAQTVRMTLHVENVYGTNNHHKAESAFKALGVAMRQAVAADSSAGVPSTKGVLA